MKYIFLFFILFLFSRSNNANAQEKKISVSADNSPLTRVLIEIQRKAPYNILFSNEVVTDSLRVSIDAVDRPVAEILQSILEPNDLFYSCRNNLILIGSRRLQVQGAAMAYSPVAISGWIVGNDNLPVAFATITLSKNDTVLIDMACTEQGHFAFGFPMQPNSTYGVSVSAVGYQPKVFTFVYPDTAKIHKIELLRQANTLRSVTVKASTPMIERKIDRLVFNLANSIAAQGTDVLEALRLTPMLKITENGIGIIGKGGVAVMINERMVHLNGSSLVSYLKSLRSDDIERIEVITTPPAKYEAQGNGGLINIVLKKNPGLGWSGNVSANYRQRTYPAYGGNVNLNYQSRRITASLKLRDIKSSSVIKEQNDIISDYAILNNSTRKNDATNIGGNLSMNYKVSGRADIGFIYDIGKSDSKSDLNIAATYQSNGITDSILNTRSKNSNPVKTQTLNIYYDQLLDSIGKKISSGINIFSNIPETNNEFLTTSDHATVAEQIKTYSLVKFSVWSAQSDITLPYKWVTIEAGAKFNHFSNHADVQYYNFLQQHYTIDHSKSNLFQYTEKNAAGYLSAQKQMNKKWGIKAGLRYEYIATSGYSPTTLEKNTTSYGKLFPTAYVSYKPDKINTFSLTYSKRIGRPYLRLVNPFRYYRNPYSYFTGNPLLQPSITHNLELSWLYKGILSFVLFGTRLNNGYGDLTFIENRFIISSPKNYLTQYSGGMIATLNIKLYPWWENSSYANYNITDSRSSIPDVVARRGAGFNYSMNNTFKHSKIFSTFLNYSQTLPSTQNNLYNYNQYDLSGGCRATMLDNKLQVGISFQKGSLVQYRIDFKDFSQHINTDYDYKSLVFNATYNFGRKKVRGNTKNINFGEKQRAN
jgi:hypothetical protein